MTCTDCPWKDKDPKKLWAAIQAEIQKQMTKPKKPRKPRADGFEMVWKELPRGGRDAAERAYLKIQGYTPEQLVESIKAHKSVEWKGRPADKIPHLSTFLNQGYYKTEIRKPKTESRPRCACGQLVFQDGLCGVCYDNKLRKEIENG